MIGHNQHFNAFKLQAHLHRFKICDCVYPEGNRVDPYRRVRGSQGRLVIAQVKNCDERAIIQAKENVHVGAVLASARCMVSLDDVPQRQAQSVFVKMPGFFGIFGPVGAAMQLLYRRGGGRWAAMTSGFMDAIW